MQYIGLLTGGREMGWILLTSAVVVLFLVWWLFDAYKANKNFLTLEHRKEL